MVLALVVSLGPLPATFTASTSMLTISPSAKPPIVALVPVTEVVLPFVVTSYDVIGRPLSSAAAHVTSTEPLAPVAVWPRRFFTGPGLLNGTTEALTGEDALEPAPMSLTDT